MPAKPARYQIVSCLCGSDVRVDVMNRDRKANCRDCGNTFDFAVTMDNVGHNSKISLILPRGALKPEGESLALSIPSLTPPGAEPEPEPEAEAEPEAEFVEVTEEPPAPPPPPPKPKKGQTVIRKTGSPTIHTSMGHCECGTVFPLVDSGELTTVQNCPQCKRGYHVVFKLVPGTTQKSAIIVPTKPIVHRRSVVGSAPPKPPKGATKTGKTVVRSRVTKVGKPPPPPKAPVEIPVGAQAVPCSCGEIFYVRRKELDQEKTCGGCGKKVTFQESRHPQTLAPILRIKPL